MLFDSLAYLDLKDRLAQQDREWNELKQEKEALAIKFSNDPELIK